MTRFETILVPVDFSAHGIVLPSSYYADLRDAAEKRLRDWHDILSKEGIKSESILSADSPSLAINLAAEEFKSDLIIMGTRGLSGLKHAMLGSVTERVVRLAPCPVLTVKHPEAD